MPRLIEAGPDACKDAAATTKSERIPSNLAIKPLCHSRNPVEQHAVPPVLILATKWFFQRGALLVPVRIRAFPMSSGRGHSAQLGGGLFGQSVVYENAAARLATG